MYCGSPAKTNEHIIATQFIDVLCKDPRGVTLPIVLYVTLPSGQAHRIPGKILKRRRYTLEYTTRVCSRCNNEWMNDMDDAAFPYLSEMIQGNNVTLNAIAREAVAGWVCKVAITARAQPFNPFPVDPEWSSWLYRQHSPTPSCCVWVGLFVGKKPFHYEPMDVRIQEPGVSGLRQNGVMATLVIGYLIAQIFGVPGARGLNVPEERALPLIWPSSTDVSWPPAVCIDDAALGNWTNRFSPPTP
jgi:hypothetical protein